MTKKEVAKICLMIRKTTHAWKNESDDEFEQVVCMWYECLKDEPYEMAQKALQEYLQTNTYPPTVADIYKPYREWQDKQKELRIEYNNIYYSSIAHYPCYEDTKEVRAEFDRITGKSVSRATRFTSILIDYVRGCEMAEEYIPPLLEWMKGMKEID